MASTLFSTVLTDQRLAELINDDYLLLAADRNALQNHEALYYVGDFAGSGGGITAGGSVRKVPIIGIDGFDLPTAVAEGAAAVPQTITDQQFTLGVGRRVKAYEPTDEVRFTDGLGVFNSRKFAEDALASHTLYLTNSIAALVGGFGLSQSTTGVDLTVAVFLAAIADLESGSQGGISEGKALCLLHTRQATDLRTSMTLSTAGAVQWVTTKEEMAVKGNGYIGRPFGVDLVASSYVPTANAGADRAGGMFLRGGIAWATMTPNVDSPSQQVFGAAGNPGTIPLLYEHSRTALAGKTAYVSSSWTGSTRGYDTSPHQLGVSIITDA